MSRALEKALHETTFKSPAELADGAYALTRQQGRVLRLLSEGHSNKVIASRLNVSEATVKAHMSEIFKNLQCQNRTQAALVGLCLRFGIPVEHILGPAANQRDDEDAWRQDD